MGSPGRWQRCDWATVAEDDYPKLRWLGDGHPICERHHEPRLRRECAAAVGHQLDWAAVPVFILRNGIVLPVPPNYAQSPDHQALVARLSTHSYADAVTALDSAPLSSWLAADLLTGTPWARRFLNTTALLWGQDRKLAARGVRALMRVLSGRELRVGRHRSPPLSPEDQARATAAVTAWRGLVDAAWSTDRHGMSQELARSANARFKLSRAHAKALVALTRRRRLRRADVVVALASWETRISTRRLGPPRAVAALIYG